jgi:hypothetical protein
MNCTNCGKEKSEVCIPCTSARIADIYTKYGVRLERERILQGCKEKARDPVIDENVGGQFIAWDKDENGYVSMEDINAVAAGAEKPELSCHSGRVRFPSDGIKKRCSHHRWRNVGKISTGEEWTECEKCFKKRKEATR